MGGGAPDIAPEGRPATSRTHAPIAGVPRRDPTTKLASNGWPIVFIGFDVRLLSLSLSSRREYRRDRPTVVLRGIERSRTADSSVASLGFGRRADPELLEGVVRAGTGPAGTSRIGDHDPTVSTAIDRHRRALDVDLVGLRVVTTRSARTTGLLPSVPSAAVERFGSAIPPALFGRRRVSTPAREFVHGRSQPPSGGDASSPGRGPFEAATEV
jgi:hypothetical protein